MRCLSGLTHQHKHACAISRTHILPSLPPSSLFACDSSYSPQPQSATNLTPGTLGVTCWMTALHADDEWCVHAAGRVQLHRTWLACFEKTYASGEGTGASHKRVHPHIEIPAPAPTRQKFACTHAFEMHRCIQSRVNSTALARIQACSSTRMQPLLSCIPH